jgi:hypothetical protein
MSALCLRGFLLALVLCASRSQAQLAAPENEPIHVTVSQNEDGSRTAYQVDPSNHHATATTTALNGKLISRIEYKLDEAGRFLTGEVFGADGKFQYKSIYKYDPANGRLAEEAKVTNKDALLLRLVFAYDGTGKQAGYSVYDANGKLVGQTKKKQ